MLGRPRSDASEQMLTILPRRRAFMAGSSARVTRNGPSRLAACSARHSASENCVERLALVHRGIVDEDVDRTERPLDLGDALVHRGRVGDVEGLDAAA